MAKEMYVGIDGVARKVKKNYIGVDGVAREVKKGYVGVDGIARQFFSLEDTWIKYEAGREYTDWSRLSTYDDTHLYEGYLLFPSYSFRQTTGFYFPTSESRYVSESDPDKLNYINWYGMRPILGNNTKTVYIMRLIGVSSNLDNPALEMVDVEKAVSSTYHWIATGVDKPQEVKSHAGELPTDGTLIEGSVEEGYCVRQEGDSYYYYIIKEE